MEAPPFRPRQPSSLPGDVIGLLDSKIYVRCLDVAIAAGGALGLCYKALDVGCGIDLWGY